MRLSTSPVKSLTAAPPKQFTDCRCNKSLCETPVNGTCGLSGGCFSDCEICETAALILGSGFGLLHEIFGPLPFSRISECWAHWTPVTGSKTLCAKASSVAVHCRAAAKFEGPVCVKVKGRTRCSNPQQKHMSFLLHF